MANEIFWRGVATGVTNYFTIHSAARTYWNTDTDGPALEALTVANWYHAAASDGNYWIALTETPGSSFFYVGDWPAGLTAVGWYWVDVYRRVGSTPAISDTLVGTIYGYWNGTKFEPAGGDIAQVAGTAQTARDLGLALPAYAPGAKGGLPKLDASTGLQIIGYGDANAKADANLISILGSAITGTAAQIVAAFTKWFNVATPTGTVNSLPDAVAGATGGVAIVGSQVDLVDSPNVKALARIKAGAAKVVVGSDGKSITLKTAADATIATLTTSDLLTWTLTVS
jgi:hypothetical protein